MLQGNFDRRIVLKRQRPREGPVTLTKGLDPDGRDGCRNSRSGNRKLPSKVPKVYPRSRHIAAPSSRLGLGFLGCSPAELSKPIRGEDRPSNSSRPPVRLGASAASE